MAIRKQQGVWLIADSLVMLSGIYCYHRLAKEKYVRLKKERDFHRMHHRRTAQEKDKLVAEIKRYSQHAYSKLRH